MGIGNVVHASCSGLSHCIQSLSQSNLVSQRSHKTWRKFVVMLQTASNHESYGYLTLL